MKKIIVLLITLLLLSVSNVYAYQSFFTYEENVLDGLATVFSNAPEPADIFCAVFIITNKTNSPINLKKVEYFAVYENGSTYRLENPFILNNEGVSGSHILNPNQRVEIECETPFKGDPEVNSIKEIYMTIQAKRVFFVRSGDMEECRKPENKVLRHLRNLWWNVVK